MTQFTTNCKFYEYYDIAILQSSDVAYTYSSLHDVDIDLRVREM